KESMARTHMARATRGKLSNLEAAISFGRALTVVRQGPILIAGHSRGGFLFVIYAGRKPADGLGVVNFFGHWLCTEPTEHLNTTYFAAAGEGAAEKVPQLWLFAERASFYDEAHIRDNHAAFEAAGGLARFEFYRGIATAGHRLRSFPDRWRPAADKFLNG